MIYQRERERERERERKREREEILFLSVWLAGWLVVPTKLHIGISADAFTTQICFVLGRLRLRLLLLLLLLKTAHSCCRSVFAVVDAFALIGWLVGRLVG